MSEKTVDDAAQEAVVEGDQPGAESAVEEPAKVEADAETEGSGEGASTKLDSLDADALKRAVRDLRRESANYRTQLQKARDEKAQVESESSSLRAELLRERVGAEAGVPAELRQRLQGSTAEEILADAKAIAAIVAPKPGGLSAAAPSGGLNSSEPPVLSPSDAAAKIRAQRY